MERKAESTNTKVPVRIYFFAEALKEVPTIFQSEVNPKSDITTKYRHLEQPFSSPFFFSEAVALLVASDAGFWTSVETLHKDLAAILIYTCMYLHAVQPLALHVNVHTSLLHNHTICTLIHGEHCSHGGEEYFVFQFRLWTEQRWAHLHRAISESSCDAV